MKRPLSKNEFVDYFCGHSRRILEEKLPEKAYEEEMILTAYNIILGHVGHIKVRIDSIKGDQQ